MRKTALREVNFQGREFKRLTSHAVYVFSKNSSVLYVGCTSKGLCRVLDANHTAALNSRKESADLRLILCRDRRQALDLESKLILELKPKYNKNKVVLWNSDVRIHPNMTTSEIARRVGCSTSLVSTIRNGQRHPNGPVAHHVQKLLTAIKTFKRQKEKKVMPRISLSEVSKGGLGFQEGRVLITESYSTMYQFPPNSSTGEQSLAFPALVWKGPRLDDQGKIMTDGDGEPIMAEIVHRMGSAEEDEKTYHIHPGKLDPKDFDNMDVEPEDLGTDLDSKGNSFVVEPGTKFSVGWGFIEDSLKKQGFKPEILGRCILTDFVGLDAHFKQQKGTAYVAKKGKNKGKEVVPENLVCDRIFPPYPYDRKAGELQKILGGKAAAWSTAAGSGATTASSKTNGAAAGSSAGSAGEEALAAAKILFAGGVHPLINGGKQVDGLSAEFKKAVPSDKTVKLDDFRKAFVSELLRKKVNPNLNKKIMEEVIRKDDQLVALSMELVDTAAGFMADTDAGTITFA